MITLTREEAQQVLDAMSFCAPMGYGPVELYQDSIKLLRARLSAPEPEPAAYQCCEHGDNEWFITPAEAYEVNPSRYKYRALYTAPPQREWQGLTDEEIRRTDHHRVDGAYDYSFKQGAQWAEAKLREKNCASNIRNKPRPK